MKKFMRNIEKKLLHTCVCALQETFQGGTRLPGKDSLQEDNTCIWPSFSKRSGKLPACLRCDAHAISRAKLLECNNTISSKTYNWLCAQKFKRSDTSLKQRTSVCAASRARKTSRIGSACLPRQARIDMGKSAATRRSSSVASVGRRVSWRWYMYWATTATKWPLLLATTTADNKKLVGITMHMNGVMRVCVCLCLWTHQSRLNGTRASEMQCYRVDVSHSSNLEYSKSRESTFIEARFLLCRSLTSKRVMLCPVVGFICFSRARKTRHTSS